MGKPSQTSDRPPHTDVPVKDDRVGPGKSSGTRPTKESKLSPVSSSEERPSSPFGAGREKPVILARGTADLFRWQNKSWKTVGGRVLALLMETGPFEYLLVNLTLASKPGANNIFLREQLPVTDLQWLDGKRCLQWEGTGSKRPRGEGSRGAWRLKFTDTGEYFNFQNLFSVCQWQGSEKRLWWKLEPDEGIQPLSFRHRMENGNEWDGDRGSVVANGNCAEPDSAEENRKSEYYDDEGTPSVEDDSEEEPYMEPSRGNNYENSQLAIGHVFDRSYVVRGTKIGVFKHDDKQKVKRMSTIEVATPRRTPFIPSKILLHDQDSSMLLTSKTKPKTMFRMDLGRGQVVDQWRFDRDIVAFAPISKFAQATQEQTFVGVSSKAILRIDPRLPGSKVAAVKLYKPDHGFSSIATANYEELAVGSDRGEVRLYNAVGQIAKTAFPSFGSPIIAVDATADGRWVVATCKTFLMVFCTVERDIAGNSNSEVTGFNKRGIANKLPIRLHLKSDLLDYMAEPVSFTPATLNSPPGQDKENTIVTSTGAFVIAWDFEKVKAGDTSSYKVAEYEDKIVANQLRFGNDEDMVVVFSHKVRGLSKKFLQ